MEPRVSVVMPVYNTGPYLRECLDSVLNQTLQEIEVLVVDDASTDNSWEIIQEYAARDSRVIAMQHATNRKQGTARNTALARARGKYINFIDSDDWIAPQMYQRLWEVAEEGSFDMVTCGIQWIDPDDPSVDIRHSFDVTIEGGENVLQALRGLNSPLIFGPCNRLHHRDLIQGASVSFPDDVFWDDVVFALDVCWRTRRLRVLPEIYYFYRQRASSTSHEAASLLHCLSMFRALQDCQQFFSVNNLRPQLADVEWRVLTGLQATNQYLCKSYLDAVDQGRARPTEGRLLNEAVRSPAFLEYLLASANGQWQRLYEAELEQYRLGARGVRYHLNCLLRAVQSRIGRSVRDTFLEVPLRRGYRLAYRFGRRMLAPGAWAEAA